MKYKKDYDMLMALISNLALAEATSRTIPGLARSTGYSEAQISAILAKYKGIFVQVPYYGERKDNPYFTLHMRYASRKGNQEDDRLPLKPEYTNTLLTFIAERVKQEETLLIQNITIAISLLTSIAAILVAALT
jgi:hypothetical protein